MDNQIEQNLPEAETESKKKNQLYPVFLKLEQLNTLLVGAGNVGLEKLHSLLSNSPEAKITIVAPINTAMMMFTFLRSSTFILLRNKKRITGISNNPPNTFL